MLKTKRIISLFLLISMLASAAACGNSEDSEDTSADSNSPVIGLDDDGNATGRDAVKNSLPAGLDFGGDTLTVLTRSDEGFREEFYAEEANGDIINDTVFERNEYVEETLNLEIEVVSKPGNYNDRKQFIADVQSSVLAGDDTYDVISYYSYAAPVMASDGLFMNLYDVENLDLTKPWWHQRFIESAEVYGKLYLVAGDICMSSVSYRSAMFFNKQHAEEYIDADLYELVESGKWTIDVFHNYIKDVYQDLNGDSKKDEKDFYGWDANGAFDPWAAATQLTYTKQKSDGSYEWNYNTEKNTEIIDGFYDRIQEQGVWFIDERNNINFKEGLRIFYIQTLSYANELRDMEDDYGILPVPKYDEAQDDYYSTASDHYSQIMAPVTCKDTAMVGAFLELMSEYSYKKLTPAYYELVMKGKYLRDDESARMFDLIIDGAWYDFAIINSSVVGDPVFVTRDAMQRKTGMFASYYAAAESRLNNSLTTLLETYKNS